MFVVFFSLCSHYFLLTVFLPEVAFYCSCCVYAAASWSTEKKPKYTILTMYLMQNWKIGRHLKGACAKKNGQFIWDSVRVCFNIWLTPISIQSSRLLFLSLTFRCCFCSRFFFLLRENKSRLFINWVHIIWITCQH